MRLTRMPSVSFFCLGGGGERRGAGRSWGGQGKESSIYFLKTQFIYVPYYLLINFPSNSLVTRLYGSGPTSGGTEVSSDFCVRGPLAMCSACVDHKAARVECKSARGPTLVGFRQVRWSVDTPKPCICIISCCI
jgi:hypothetical protein